MIEAKVGKLPTKPTILTTLFYNDSKVANLWWIFAKLYDRKTFTDCFVLEA